MLFEGVPVVAHGATPFDSLNGYRVPNSCCSYETTVASRCQLEFRNGVEVGQSDERLGAKSWLTISHLGPIAGIAGRTSPDLPARHCRGELQKATEVSVCSSRSLEAIRLRSGFFQPVRHTHLLV